TDELRLLADLHLPDSLGPALDDAVEREVRRLAPLVRAVEDGSVHELALVVDLDLVGFLRARSRSRLHRAKNDSRRKALRARLLRGLLGEPLALLLLGADGLRGDLLLSLLRELRDLLLPLVRIHFRLGPALSVVVALIDHLLLRLRELQLVDP